MADTMNCKICQINDPKEKVICDGCKGIICKKCCELSETEWRCIGLKKRVLSFLCNDCKKGFALIPELIRQVQDLQNEVLNLKKNLESNIVNNLDSEQIYSEIQDRAVRSKNIIIHNVIESNSGLSTERIDYDKNECMKVFNTMNVNIDEFKAIRLGKSGNKPRPLKVIFSDSSTTLSCLKNKKKLKDTNIRVSADLTPIQREYIKELHRKLEERKSNGENDIYIGYRHGVPRIVKKPTTKSKN